MKVQLEKVISSEQYSSLKPEDKAKYKVYVAEADPEMKAGLDLANAEIKAAAYLKPLHDKIMAMPVDLPGKQFAQAIETLETMIKLIDPIKALMNVPIIGQLVKPLVDFLNNLIATIGLIFYILCCLILMKDVFTDSYVKAIDDVKWDELADAMETIRLKKEAYEKAKKQKEEEDAKKTEEQKKAEADARQKEREEQKKKIRDAVEKELKKQKEDMEKQIEKMLSGIKLSEAYAKIMRAMKASLQQYSWKEGNVKQITKKVLESVGVDLSPLDQMTPAQEKAFMNNFPDPKDQIDKMNKTIQKINKNTKYILIEDVDPVVIEVEDPKEEVDIKTIKLSPHFSLYELCYSSTADEKKIDNTPSESEIENLRLLCVNILEPVYRKFGKPVITSGYRNPEVNKLVNGVKNSEHIDGKAVDFTIPSVSNEVVYGWISSNCNYRQLIYENGKNSIWIHVSYDPYKNKKQDLAFTDGRYIPNLLTSNNKTLV